MYRRLNITLSDDVLSRADQFARRERYTRSSLITAALNAFMDRDPRLIEAEGVPGVYAPESVGLNPAVRPFLPEIIRACREGGTSYAALVGPSTRPDPAIVPRDLEVLVRFDADHEHITHRLVLQARIELLTGKPVRLIAVDEVHDEERLREFDRTAVVLYDAGAPDA